MKRNVKRIFINFVLLLTMVCSVNGIAIAADDWLGFKNGTSPQNRETELKQKCSPSFRRVEVPITSQTGSYPATFSELCRVRGKTCQYACDWEGNKKDCDEISQRTEFFGIGYANRDGSRIALCY